RGDRRVFRSGWRPSDLGFCGDRGFVAGVQLRALPDGSRSWDRPAAGGGSRVGGRRGRAAPRGGGGAPANLARGERSVRAGEARTSEEGWGRGGIPLRAGPVLIARVERAVAVAWP